MNHIPGILYIINGTVKCAEREKPEEPIRENYPDGLLHEVEWAKDYMWYKAALKSWQESCKNALLDVVNVGCLSGNMLFTDRRHDPIKWFRSGQKCLFVPEGEVVRITKIL